MNQSHPLNEAVIFALKQIYDPEIPVNIVDLGLIYSIDIDDEGQVNIQMTLTSPGCPVAESFPQMVQDAVFKVPEVTGVKVQLVWEPTWSKDLMSESAKLALDMF